MKLKDVLAKDFSESVTGENFKKDDPEAWFLAGFEAAKELIKNSIQAYYLPMANPILEPKAFHIQRRQAERDQIVCEDAGEMKV